MNKKLMVMVALLALALGGVLAFSYLRDQKEPNNSNQDQDQATVYSRNGKITKVNQYNDGFTLQYQTGDPGNPGKLITLNKQINVGSDTVVVKRSGTVPNVTLLPMLWTDLKANQEVIVYTSLDLNGRDGLSASRVEIIK